MTLTPIFRLEQTEENLKVCIHAPMAKLSEMEVCIENQTFYFSGPPYYLSFELPGSVLEDEDTFGIELVETDVIITLKKCEAVLFKNLELVTKLLLKSSPKVFEPLIQELSDEKSETKWCLDWLKSQQLNSENESVQTDFVVTSPTYGFGCSKSGLFSTECDWTYVVDLPNPDKTSCKTRSKLRQIEEESKFSAYHYLADYFEPEVWEPMKKIELPWFPDSSPVLTDNDRHHLIVLSSRRLPPTPSTNSEQKSLYLGLLDLLLAYTYDFRVREGEPMTESGWNIAKLSSTLSWFEVFDLLPDVLISFYRRALTYPLVRSWHFCTLIKRDVASLLQHTKVKEWCVKCLLEMRELLISYPGYYVFADLYVNDYIVWIQTRTDDDLLHDLGKTLENFKLKKDEVGLRLNDVERLGKECLNQENLKVSFNQLSLDDNTNTTTTTDNNNVVG